MLWDHFCIAQSSSIARSKQGNHCLAWGLLFCDVTSQATKWRVIAPARRLHPSLALCPLQQEISSCEFYVTTWFRPSTAPACLGLKTRFYSPGQGGGCPQCKMKSLRSSLQHFHLCYLPRESSPLSSLQSRIYFWEPSYCCPSPWCLVPAPQPFSDGLLSTVGWTRDRGDLWRSAAKGATVSNMLKISQTTLEVKWLLWIQINSAVSRSKQQGWF